MLLSSRESSWVRFIEVILGDTYASDSFRAISNAIIIGRSTSSMFCLPFWLRLFDNQLTGYLSNAKGLCQEIDNFD